MVRVNDLGQKVAWIYCRFSPRPNAGECESNDKQYERCTVYADQKNYFIAGRYEDAARSGSELHRPGLMELTGCLKPGDVLVVNSPDRLARDLRVHLAIEEQVEETGATIEYADGTVSDNTPEGKLQRGIIALFAAYERDRIKLNTKRGLDKKRQNCERTTGKIPIGWKLDPEDPKKLVRNFTERNAIIFACELHVDGYRSAGIARTLGTLGLCRGKPWSPRTVRHLIRKHSFWAGPGGDLALEPDHP
ncbi:MAG: recombinase family protein [bacterium]|nr:recombinase family protein [bacterium]